MFGINKCRPILVQGLRRDMKIFHLPCNKVSVAQLIEGLAGEPKIPGWIPSQGEFFFTSIFFKEEMNQMVNKKENNNNSRNSLVFGLWPQTKINYRISISPASSKIVLGPKSYFRQLLSLGDDDLRGLSVLPRHDHHLTPVGLDDLDLKNRQRVE